MKKFLFTLDCELGWGEPNPPDERWDSLRSDPSAGRDLYLRILDIFRKHDIPATWAFVGHLFFDECTVDCHYNSDHISKYDPYTDRETSPLYYGDDLVAMVQDDEIEHEIAGHSFSHSMYSELTKEEARQDLQALVDVAETNGYELKSFVFPSNQVAHTELLTDHGFSVYRGHMQETSYTYKSGFRALLTNPGAFLITPPTTPITDNYGAIRLPTSRLLRDKRWWFLQPRRLRRGVASMSSDQHIHFTIHPHNFLDSKHLFRTFDSVLSIIADLRDQGQIEAITMGDLAHS